MLCSIEVLTRELAHPCSDTVIQPSSFSIHHGSRRHVFALDIHETQIRSEIAAALPERSRMEMESLPVDERCTIDIYRSSESVWMRIGNEVIHLSTPIVRVHAQKVATLKASISISFSHTRHTARNTAIRDDSCED